MRLRPCEADSCHHRVCTQDAYFPVCRNGRGGKVSRRDVRPVLAPHESLGASQEQMGLFFGRAADIIRFLPCLVTAVSPRDSRSYVTHFARSFFARAFVSGVSLPVVPELARMRIKVACRVALLSGARSVQLPRSASCEAPHRRKCQRVSAGRGHGGGSLAVTSAVG